MSVKVHEAVCLDSAQDKYFWFDHFLGDQLQDEWHSTGFVGGSADVVDAQTGGIVRITTDNDVNDAWRIDWNNIRSLHVSKRVAMEVRAKANQATLLLVVLQIMFDGNDQILFVANETVGGAVNWDIRCRDGGAASSFDSGVTFDTNYHIFRIECHTHGGSHVHFYIDGVETANSPIDTNIPDDAGDYLQPYLIVETYENVAKSMDIDYVVIRQDR